jgi:hypothetical protein
MLGLSRMIAFGAHINADKLKAFGEYVALAQLKR